MPGLFFVPHLCPVNVLPCNPTRLPQYASKDMDNYTVAERFTRWQQGAPQYLQPWLTVDSIRMQFITNQGAAQVDLIDCHYTVYKTLIATQKQLDPYTPGSYYIYEANMALNDLPDGQYFLHIFTNYGEWITEPLDVRAEHENTILLEFAHHKYYGMTIFEGGFKSNIRVAGLLRLRPPVSKDTLYEDQVLDMTMVQSKPYRIWECIVGVPNGAQVMGLPDWMIEKLNWVLGCSDLRFDGRYMAKNEGFKWEDADKSYEGLLVGYRGELREQINRNAKAFDPLTNTAQRLVIALNVDSRGFADTALNAGSNLVTFENVE